MPSRDLAKELSMLAFGSYLSDLPGHNEKVQLPLFKRNFYSEVCMSKETIEAKFDELNEVEVEVVEINVEELQNDAIYMAVTRC